MGTHYHHGDVVMCSFDEDIPVFALMKSFVITPTGECLFIAELLQTNNFNHHYHSWEVVRSNTIYIFKQVDLIDYHPLPLVRNRYICMKHHVFDVHCF